MGLATFRRAPHIHDMGEIRHAKFSIGQVVRHRLYPFRGLIFDIDPEFAGPIFDVIPTDRSCKGFIFQLLSYGFQVNLGDTFRRFYIRNCRQETCQFVSGKERFLEWTLTRHAAIVGVRKYGSANVFLDSAFG